MTGTGGAVAETIVSSKFQVVIPKEVRNAMGLKTGQVLQVVGKRGVITLVPDQPVAKLRGFVKGMKIAGLRDKKDRY